MYGVAAIAADLILRPRHGDLAKEPYVSKYPAAPMQPTIGPVEQALIKPTDGARGALWAVVAAAFVGLIATFSMHLVNLRMQNLGIAASAISLSVAIQALGICVTALAAKRLIARAGLSYTLPASSMLCGVVLVTIFYNTDIYVINALRILFAIGLTFLVIASEYLVTARCEERNRGSAIASYTTALGAGTIIGPFFVSIMSIDDSSSFLTGAALLLFGGALLRICLSKHEGKTTRSARPFAAFGFMPIIFIAAFIFGMADNGGLSLLPIYGGLNGYDTSSAAHLAMFAALGATLLQFPIAWLAMKRNTTHLLLTLSVCSLCLLALLPIVVGGKFITYLVAAGLGALFEGLYTVALVGISRERRLQNLAALNACFISVCSLGEVAGPVASGISIEYFGPHGFVVALLIVFAIYVLGLLNRWAPKPSHSLTFN